MIIDIEPVSFGISLAALAAFILPIYIGKKKQISLHHQNQKKFLNEANKNGLLLEKKDFWRDGYAIGIDNGKNKVLYMDTRSNPQFKLICTDEITEIKLRRESRNFGKGLKKEEIIDKLSLNIITNSPLSNKLELVFFDGERHSDLSGEWPLIKKWNEILTANIKQQI
jgi:hypothetical protein